MGYIYLITNLINSKKYVGKLQLLQMKDGRNIVEIVEEKDVKNVHYMMLSENMELKISKQRKQNTWKMILNYPKEKFIG